MTFIVRPQPRPITLVEFEFHTAQAALQWRDCAIRLGCVNLFFIYITFFNLPRPATATATATATTTTATA